MLFSIVALLAAGASAAPSNLKFYPRQNESYIPCSGLYSNALCCATDVLGVADLDCGDPPSLPTSADSFSQICSEIGQRARCCALPLLEQGILCNTPTGVQD